MAVQNNLRECKTWFALANPQVVPPWQLDILLRQNNSPPPASRPVVSRPTQIPPTGGSASTSALPPLPRPGSDQIGAHSPQRIHSNVANPALKPPQRPITASTQINIEDISDFSDNDSDSFKLIDTAGLGVNKRQAPLDAPAPKKSRVSPQISQASDIRLKPEPVAVLSVKIQSKLPLNSPQTARGSNEARPSPNEARFPSNEARIPSNASRPGVLAKRTESASLLASTANNNVGQLHEYIRVCEAKINLLTKSQVINDSTSLSLDAKKLWHANNYLPKFKEVEAKQVALRSKFTFLDPLPTEEDMSRLSSNNPQLSSMVSVSNDISAHVNGTVDGIADGIVDGVVDGVVERIISSPPSVSISAEIPMRNVVPTSPICDDAPMEDYEANKAEARRIIMENKNRPPQAHVHRNVDDEDDLEDEFGEGFMDGLNSSQVDNEDTDLSGFVARDDNDDGVSVDETFCTPQGTQVDSQMIASDDDDDVDSGDEALARGLRLRDEMKDIILSQDVADRYGMKYEDISEPIEVSDDDNEVNNMDFTTQLNEGRDEVVEILSDDDLDAEDLNALTELLHSRIDIPKPKLQIVSESDFSDDDDELIQLSKTVTTTGKKRVLSGSEKFVDEVYDVLHDVFKLPDFRSNQLEAIVATLIGKDVFVLIPTGGGKSLCYQLPALVQSGKTKGTTVVISPLISLMQDQVQHLQDKNINAGMISSKGTSDERNQTFRALTSGQLDLVYLSPEMINNSGRVQKVIAKLYENNMLARVVVDEAHCVSSWGHDFRPDYKGMNIFKQLYPNVPIMALTATANEKVRLDIVHHLRMSNPVLLKQSFNRTNLFYEVRNKPSNIYEWVRDYVLSRHAGKTGIIYCHSKQSCETTSQKLNEWGIKCMYYHAGMDPNERFDVQTQWQHNKIQLICATIAFGMGIDKPDVRFVIHMYIPRSLEGYYQETGRAGRDGKESECIMFYSYKDARSLQSLIQRDDKIEQSARETHLAKLRQVVQYCENQTDCRRRQVLHFFNETFDPKECQKKCDNCCSEVVSVTRDVTEHCLNIVKMVGALQHDKVTVIHCQDVYKGSKSNKIMKLGHNHDPNHGKGKDLDRGDIERIFFHLQSEGCLLEYQVMKGGFASTYVRLGSRSNEILDGRKRIELSFAQNSRPNSSGKNRLLANGNGPGLTNFRYQESFVSAREVRYEQEKENIDWRSSGSKIVLSRQNFNGAVSSSNERAIEHAFGELRNLRLQKLQELGYGRPSFFISDDLLKEMAIKLPTNAKDFGKLDHATKEQVPFFQYFKKALGSLSRERKKSSQDAGGFTQNSTVTQANSTISENASPYFQRTPQNSQPRKRSQKYNNSQRKQNGYKRTNGGSAGRKNNTSSGHIRQMPI